MELLLFRHARAELGSAEVPDAGRALTPEGRLRFARAVRNLERLEVDLDRIYHSPLLRAVESAEILTRLLDGSGETVVTPLLAAPHSAELLDLLEGERVALVGHEPWLSGLLAWLLVGEPASEADGQGPLFDFKKGGLAWLGGPLAPGAMALRAFLPPRALGRIARA